MEKLSLIKEIYEIDDNDLDERKEAIEKLAPYVDEIMGKFYEKLLSKDELAEFIPKEKIPELKKKQISFIKHLLSYPFDEKMYKYIAHVGIVHYHIRLDPISMSYGYHILSHLILSQSQKDPTLLPYLKLVIKYLKVSEAIMGQEYFAQKSIEKSPYRANDLFIAVNELYARYSLCRRDIKEIIDAQTGKFDIKKAEAFKESLEKLKDYRDILNEINLNISTVKRYCTELENEKDRSKLTNIAKLLDNSIMKPLNDLSVSAYMTLGSSLASLRAMTDILYRRSTQKSAQISINKAKENIRTILENTYGWAIETLEFPDYEPQDEDFDIVKHLYFANLNKIIYLGINIKSISNEIYIKEGLDLLGEAIKLTIFLSSKE